MMYANSESTKHSVVLAVVALAVVMSGQRAQAQPGTVPFPITHAGAARHEDGD